jgi:hypothetical protein
MRFEFTLPDGSEGPEIAEKFSDFLKVGGELSAG